MFNDMGCRVCGESEVEESQSHQLDCITLINRCPKLYNDSIINYDDIYGDINKQLRVTKLFDEVLTVRDKIMEEQGKYGFHCDKVEKVFFL